MKIIDEKEFDALKKRWLDKTNGINAEEMSCLINYCCKYHDVPDEEQPTNQVEQLVMCCDGCKYLGQRFEHLNNHENGKWYNCKYPLPFHIHNKAVPWVSEKEHKCEVKST